LNPQPGRPRYAAVVICWQSWGSCFNNTADRATDDEPTLLIVDDEKPTREGLRAALEERYECLLAENAAAAMDLMEREPFDAFAHDFRLRTKMA